MKSKKSESLIASERNGLKTEPKEKVVKKGENQFLFRNIINFIEKKNFLFYVLEIYE